jgi:modulator of FtsH protease HflC
MKRRPIFWILAVAAVTVAALSSSFFSVSENEQALVTRFGRPIAVIRDPGFHVKRPFVDSVTYYDARLLPLDPPTEQVILGDQKRIEVDTFTWFRIVDPLRFFQSLHTLAEARSQLTVIVGSSVRRELGQVALPALLTAEREKIISAIRAEVAEKARPLGIEVAETRIHRADLPPETSQAIYDRMKSERLREAKELRAQGFEWAQQIQARADRERTVILSEATRAATISRGEGDAEASRRLSEAFGADAKFYQFYRSVQTYRKSLADSGATLLLSPDADFLRLLVAGPGSELPAAAPK